MMVEQLGSILFALFGLGVLVFIHELGHFLVARREGMTVEVFSIGFGPVLFSWVHRGVRWQVCAIPCGGYVKIAGMQREGGREPHEIPGGFFNKEPMQRVRVAVAGPLVNVLFALLIFCFLWVSGGREKPFSEFTHHVGWLSERSPLYALGMRPGDRVDSYDGHPFSGARDLLISSVMKGGSVRVAGTRGGDGEAFDYTLSGKGLASGGPLFIPANYCIFVEALAGSPLLGTEMQKGDRVLWADGEVVYSLAQLHALINESSVFLTVQRGDEVIQGRVPRVRLGELRLGAVQRAEFDDWLHEAGLGGTLSDTFFVPYLLSPRGEVEAAVALLDESSFVSLHLEEGDRIVAVDGERVEGSYDLLERVQERRVLMVVQRDGALGERVSWRDADGDFENELHRADLAALVHKIGVSEGSVREGNLVLLPAVAPKPASEFSLLAGAKQLAVVKKKLDAIRDPEERREAYRQFEKEQGMLRLGAYFWDRDVRYNPGPFRQLSDSLGEMGVMLKGLCTGQLHPKHVTGPVGIVHVFQRSLSLGGVREVLFWMAMISFNLGLMNLLPLPVLDGGHIVFSLYEAVTKRRLSAKVMERLMIPFVALLVLLFLYVTYQDVIRLFSRLFW